MTDLPENRGSWDWWPLARLLTTGAVLGLAAHHYLGWTPDFRHLARLPREVFEVIFVLHLGTELALEIATDSRLRRTRILGISGMHQPGLNEGFFSRGTSEFLQKPFTPSEFVGSVSRLLA